MKLEEILNKFVDDNRSDLVEDVVSIIKDNTYNFSDLDIVDWLIDVSMHGCDSEISGLLYYSDNTAFFNKHQRELTELLGDLRVHLCDIINYDEGDPLCYFDPNKTNVVWFTLSHYVNKILTYVRKYHEK